MHEIETVYVPVQGMATYARSIPSDADVSSGYYLAYVVATGANGGGFTGNGWCTMEEGNPFQGYDFQSKLGTEYTGDVEKNIITYYNKFRNLDDIFRTWTTRVDEREWSSFCHNMMQNDKFYYAGCIHNAN